MHAPGDGGIPMNMVYSAFETTFEFTPEPFETSLRIVKIDDHPEFFRLPTLYGADHGSQRFSPGALMPMTLPVPVSAGLELEMPVIDAHSGQPMDARTGLASLLRAGQGQAVATPCSDASGFDPATVLPVAIDGAWGTTGFDNGYNNIEVAFAPVHRSSRGLLNPLAETVFSHLAALDSALAEVGMALTNFSEHPATEVSPHFYRQMRAPKRIYDHWVTSRGWDHAVGIDAKAQNGPTTGVAVDDATRALNLILLASPMLIAIHANSPFEAGRPSGLSENRLSMWPRMFRHARHAGDLRLCQPPTEPFADLGAYFRWMFANDTAIHAFGLPGQDYKSLDDLYEAENAPPLLRFLAADRWRATALGGGPDIEVTPSLTYLEHMQFAQFLDARIRFGLATDVAGETGLTREFLAAVNGDQPRRVEHLFATLCTFIYIEGRAAGANLPDRDIREHAGDSVAASMVMGPSAIQAGLLAHPDAWERLASRIPWSHLDGLRDAAIRSGMGGRYRSLALRELCELVLGLATEGLESDEQWMLDYPIHVLECGQNGADRARAFVAEGKGPLHERLLALTTRRTMNVSGPPIEIPTGSVTAAAN